MRRARPVKILAAVFLAAAWTPILSPSARAAGTLTDPSGNVMCLLYYKLAKQTPPFDRFASAAESVRAANEFHRQKAMATEKARLQAVMASLAPVTAVRVNIDMSMGRYDSDLGEYDLSGFSADQYLQFGCPDNTVVRLRFNNADDAQSWSLKPKAAEAVLRRNRGERYVMAETTVALTGVDTTVPGEPKMMVGDVTRVSLFGTFNHAPLGHYAVKTQ